MFSFCLASFLIWIYLSLDSITKREPFAMKRELSQITGSFLVDNVDVLLVAEPNLVTSLKETQSTSTS